MKKQNKLILIISILAIVLVADGIFYYQYKHISYKYYWNRLINKTQTVSLDKDFVLETGVLAKLENTDLGYMFVDHFQKDLPEDALVSCIDCPEKDYYDEDKIYINNEKQKGKFDKKKYPYIFQELDCGTKQKHKLIDKNENGKRCFVAKKINK